MSAKHTPGPWEWFMHPAERPYLATPDRGRLYVMGFARKGMQGATPIFSQWNGIDDGAERGRTGGVMCDGILLKDGRLHPDARLIAAAPELLAKCEKVVSWLDRMSESSEREAAKHTEQFPSLSEAFAAEAKNYRATAKDIRSVIAKATGEQS